MFTLAQPLRKQAFTLVEIMIVVVIIGLLAAMAVPVVQKIREHSMSSRFVNDCRVFNDAAQVYMLANGVPEITDGSTGVLPPELVGYISASSWQEDTPIGGRWDFDSDYGFLGVGAVSPILTADALDRLDTRHDDGNRSTGKIRIVSSRVYWVID